MRVRLAKRGHAHTDFFTNTSRLSQPLSGVVKTAASRGIVTLSATLLLPRTAIILQRSDFEEAGLDTCARVCLSVCLSVCLCLCLCLPSSTHPNSPRHPLYVDFADSFQQVRQCSMRRRRRE